MKNITRVKLGLADPAIIATGIVIFIVACIPIFHIVFDIPVREVNNEPIYEVKVGVGNLIFIGISVLLITMRHGVQIDTANYKIRHYSQVLWFYLGSWEDLKPVKAIIYRTLRVKKFYGLMIRSSRAPSYNTIVEFKTIEFIFTKRSHKRFITGNKPKLEKILLELEKLDGINILRRK